MSPSRAFTSQKWATARTGFSQVELGKGGVWGGVKAGAHSLGSESREHQIPLAVSASHPPGSNTSDSLHVEGPGASALLGNSLHLTQGHVTASNVRGDT